jgi:glycosyltransferase involved in cell wall biosynthesis
MPPDEIVLSDDASVDGTVELVEALMAGAGSIRLRVIRNEHPLGVVKNFEQAVLATSGEVVMLSDQDDRWHPDRVARTVAAFSARPGLLLVHSDADLVDAHGAPLGVSLFGALEATAEELRGISEGSAFDVLIRRNLALGASMAFRRRLLDEAVPFPPGWIHDEWLAIVAAALGPDTVAVIADPLLDYRQHGDNQIGARKLSLRAKAGRLREGRTARNERLRVASIALRDRLSALAVDPDILRKAEEKVVHEEARSAYPASRWRRPVPVFREWRSGRYRLSGHGWTAVAGDLLQSAD